MRYRGKVKFVILVLIAVLQTAFFSAQVPAAGVRVLWRTPLGPGESIPTGIPASDGTRFFLATSRIMAFSQDSGRLLWTASITRYVPCKLIAADGKIIVVEQEVYALDANTGQLLWKFVPDSNASLGQATVDGAVLFFGTSSHHLYALNVSNGKMLWNVELGPDWKYPGVVRGVTVNHGELYVAVEQWRSENGHVASGWLFALNAESGKSLWSHVRGSGEDRIGFSSSPVVAGNLILLSDYLSNSLVAVHRKTHRLVWLFQGEKGFVGVPEPPVVENNDVYMVSGDTYAYELSLSDGALVRRIPLHASNEALVLCRDKLLINHQGITVMNKFSGAVEGTLFDREDEFTSSEFAKSGDIVFVAGPKAAYGLRCSKPEVPPNPENSH